MSARDKPALSAVVSPRSLEESYAGFTPSEGAGSFVSQGDPVLLPAGLREAEPKGCDALTPVRFRSTSLIG
jgi:hypothetical protein